MRTWKKLFWSLNGQTQTKSLSLPLWSTQSRRDPQLGQTELQLPTLLYGLLFKMNAQIQAFHLIRRMAKNLKVPTERLTSKQDGCFNQKKARLCMLSSTRPRQACSSKTSNLKLLAPTNPSHFKPTRFASSQQLIKIQGTCSCNKRKLDQQPNLKAIFLRSMLTLKEFSILVPCWSARMRRRESKTKLKLWMEHSSKLPTTASTMSTLTSLWDQPFQLRKVVQTKSPHSLLSLPKHLSKLMRL